MNMDDQDWEPPSEADMKLIAARRERSDQISKLMSGYLLKGYKMLGSVCDACDTILLQDRQGTNYCVACSELDSDTHKDDPAINQSAAMSMARELEMASAAASSSPSGNNLTSRVSPSLQAPAATSADVQNPSNRSATSILSSPLSTQTQNRPDVKPKVSREEINANLSISSIDVQSFTTNVVTSVKDQTTTATPRQHNNSDGGADSGFYSARVSDKRYSGAGGDGNILLVSDSVHVCRLQDKINWASQELNGTHNVEYSIQLCELIKSASEAIVALRNARM